MRTLKVVLGVALAGAAIFLAFISIGLTAAIMNEYGAGVGYMEIALQTVPISVVGVAIAVFLVWVSARVLRSAMRRSSPAKPPSGRGD